MKKEKNTNSQKLKSNRILSGHSNLPNQWRSNDGRRMESKREFPLGSEGYFIEINTLEELENLRLECGEELVLTASQDYQDIPCIEIYNNYRE